MHLQRCSNPIDAQPVHVGEPEYVELFGVELAERILDRLLELALVTGLEILKLDVRGEGEVLETTTLTWSAHGHHLVQIVVAMGKIEPACTQWMVEPAIVWRTRVVPVRHAALA